MNSIELQKNGLKNMLNRYGVIKKNISINHIFFISKYANFKIYIIFIYEKNQSIIQKIKIIITIK
jgi:hypothetical protein